jgi:hypothetical protein
MADVPCWDSRDDADRQYLKAWTLKQLELPELRALPTICTGR